MLRLHKWEFDATKAEAISFSLLFEVLETWNVFVVYVHIS